MMYFYLFGITSFGLCFMLFLLGVKILYKKDLLPMGNLYHNNTYMLWGSVFLAYFSENTNFIAGSFGFHINQWLTQILGSIGTITLTMVVLYIITTLLFNPDYKALSTIYFRKKKRPKTKRIPWLRMMTICISLTP